MKEPAVHGFTIQNEEKAEVDGQGEYHTQSLMIMLATLEH
jgi:hypothetical protein